MDKQTMELSNSMVPKVVEAKPPVVLTRVLFSQEPGGGGVLGVGYLKITVPVGKAAQRRHSLAMNATVAVTQVKSLSTLSLKRRVVATPSCTRQRNEKWNEKGLQNWWRQGRLLQPALYTAALG